VTERSTGPIDPASGVGPAGSGEPAQRAYADPSLRLDAWRAQGAQRHDPVRFRFLEALARRAALHDGPVRQWLDQRLDQALTDFAERHPAEWAAADPTPPGIPPPTGLAALVQALNELAAATSSEPSRPTVPGTHRPAELKAWRQSRGTWTQLSIERQLSRSLAKAPDNPGPFNSHGLVLRSLQVMRDIAPAYLHRFMAHVDALLWLDQTAASAPAAAPSPRREPEPRRKPSRGTGA
jgi:Protein of unknown function (DUF2894)